ncbi:MAG: hypothetical protein JWM95_5326 [Gemmatimonadetes bacterium]|nr:hypothetical protein [Gemmatimonadota bacterium]
MTEAKGMGRGLALYALSCVVVIGLAGGVLTAVYGPVERPAVWISAGIALVSQLVSFAIARMMADRGNGIAGWGVGALICLAVLVVFGFVSRALGLPQTAALVSLATYFSLTELIEAPFLFL